MDRGYLGAAKLSGACEPEGKISVETLSAALLLMTPAHSPCPFTHLAPARNVTAKLMTFHFRISRHVAR